MDNPNPYTTKNILSSSTMQNQAQVNPYTYTIQDNLSSSMQQKTSVNPNPYPTRTTSPASSR